VTQANICLHNWRGCVTTENDVVLAGPTAEELKEIKALGQRGISVGI
jgi:hypothetical protein